MSFEPPVDDANQSTLFTSLWENKVQIRRFKDGTNIYAVIWDEYNEGGSDNNDGESLPTKKKVVEEYVQHLGRDLKMTTFSLLKKMFRIKT